MLFLLFALCALLRTPSLIPHTSFTVLLHEPASLKMSVYQIAGFEVALKERQDLMSWPSDAVKGYDIVHAQYSPERAWLALGLRRRLRPNDLEDLLRATRCLLIINVETGKVVFHQKEAQDGLFLWFRWCGENVLETVERVKPPVPSREKHFARFRLSGPDWSVTKQQVSPPSTEYRLPASPDGKARRQRVMSAAQFLERTSYRDQSPVLPGSTLGLDPVWLFSIDRVNGDVSDDGNQVAVKIRNQPKVIWFHNVLQSTHEEQVVTLQNPKLWLLRFWDEWLIVGSFSDQGKRTIQVFPPNGGPSGTIIRGDFWLAEGSQEAD